MACRALKLDIEAPAVALMDTRCATCGDAISRHQNCVEREKEYSFNDHHFMADPLSIYLCGPCARVMKADYMSKYSDVVITRTAVYPFSKNVDRSWFFLNPPKPPFVMHVHDSKNQHLTWRSPVNLSQELYRVRLGQNVLNIRRPILKEAIARHADLTQRLSEIRGYEVNRIHDKFDSTGRSLKSSTATTIRGHVRALASSHPDVAKKLRFFDEIMTAGETWALLHILNTDSMAMPAPFA